MLLNKLPQKSMATSSEHLFHAHGPAVDCSLADVDWAQLGGSVSHYELAGIDSTLEHGFGSLLPVFVLVTMRIHPFFLPFFPPPSLAGLSETCDRIRRIAKVLKINYLP